MQIIPTDGLQSTSFNATTLGTTGGNLSVLEKWGQNTRQEFKSGQDVFSQAAQHVQHGAGIIGPGPPPSALINSGNQGQNNQNQVHPWHMQNPFPPDHQWQRQVNPFVQGIGQ